MPAQIVEQIMETVVARNPGETEFHRAVHEVAESVAIAIAKHPELAQAKIFERIMEPER